MKQFSFTIDIQASREKIWSVLWSDASYRIWTTNFHTGSYAVSDWNEGSKIHFLTPDGEGMFAVIEKKIINEHIAFRYLGVIKNFAEDTSDAEGIDWSEGFEKYTLTEIPTGIRLTADMNGSDHHVDFFNATFPKALNSVKELCEKPFITIETTVASSLGNVWKHWNTPESIMAWCHASDDWHAPAASVDLQVGGKFSTTMAAKDGSFSFDFGGVYDIVIPNRRIDYTMGDGRKAFIYFTEQDGATKVVETFEAETENPIEMQQGGWQMILNNFKIFTEKN
ncbi:MAG: SRPBCC domain-containing protein [Bacteroidia bacterium]